MFRFLFAMSLGVAVGYQFGWSDRERNQKHVFQRLQARTEGVLHEFAKNNVDSLNAATAQTDSALQRVGTEPAH